MKKSIAVFLIVCMVMPFMLVYGETAETYIAAEPIVVSENVKLLAALGIFDEEFFTKPKDQMVTRGEFAYIVSTVDAQKIDYTASDYTDVADDNPYVSEIEHARCNNFIEDYVDGKFRPDNNITYEKALRALVHLTGNATYASVKNYDLVVRQLGISTGVTAKKTSGITFEQAAQLIVNTITAPVLDLYAVDSRGNVSMTDLKHENILERNFDIYNTKGIIDSTYISSINSALSPADPGRFVVNGVDFECGKLDVALLLGYNIEFYYKYDSESGKRTALYMMPLEDDNDIIEIEAKDVDVNGRTLNYYIRNRKKSFRITNRTDVILNGKRVESYNEKIFDMDGGGVAIVNNGSKTFVSVKNVKEIYIELIGKTDGKVFMASYDKNYDLSTTGDEVIYSIFKDGEKIDIDSISKTDVFEMVTDALNSDGTFDFTNCVYVGGVVTASTIDCTLNKLFKDNIVVSVDDKNAEYRKSEKVKEAIDKGKLKELEVNAGYTLYFNSNGEIAYFLKSYDAEEKYGYILKYGIKHEAFEDIVRIELFNSDGETKQYTFTKKLKIDGRLNEPSVLITNLDSLKKELSDPEDESVKHLVLRSEERMVKYLEDANGNLKSIDTCVPNSTPSDDELTCTTAVEVGAKSQKLDGYTIGNACILDKSAPRFVIPKCVDKNGKFTGVDMEDPKNYGVGTATFKLAGSSGVWFTGVYAYNLDEYGVCKAVAAYPYNASVGGIDVKSAMPRGVLTAFETVCNDGDIGINVIITGTENEEVVGYVENKDELNKILQCAKKPYKDDEKTIPNIAQIGDLIRYKINDGGELIGVDILVSIDTIKSKTPFISKKLTGDSTIEDTDFKNQYIYRVLYGVPVKVGPQSMVVANSLAKDAYGNLLEENYEYFTTDKPCFIVTMDRNGRPVLKSSDFSYIKTYDDYRTDADWVAVWSGYGGIFACFIMRY